MPLAQANTHSYEKRTATLREYLRDAMHPWSLSEVAPASFYHFGNNNYSSWTNFSEHYLRPPYHCTLGAPPRLAALNSA